MRPPLNSELKRPVAPDPDHPWKLAIESLSNRIAATECIRLVEILSDSTMPEGATGLALIVLARLNAIGEGNRGNTMDVPTVHRWMKIANSVTAGLNEELKAALT